MIERRAVIWVLLMKLRQEKEGREGARALQLDNFRLSKERGRNWIRYGAGGKAKDLTYFICSKGNISRANKQTKKRPEQKRVAHEKRARCLLVLKMSGKRSRWRRLLGFSWISSNSLTTKVRKVTC